MKFVFYSSALFIYILSMHSHAESWLESSIRGKDKNKNFIRDDVEQWIFVRTSDQNLRNGLLQYATSLQRLLLIPLTEHTLYLENYSKYKDANACLGLLSNDKYLEPQDTIETLRPELRQKILNSLFRRLFFWLSEFKLTNQDKSFKILSPTELVLACEFRIIDLNKYLPVEARLSEEEIKKINRMNDAKK